MPPGRHEILTKRAEVRCMLKGKILLII